jgi:hypothetical protein
MLREAKNEKKMPVGVPRATVSWAGQQGRPEFFFWNPATVEKF